MTFSREHPIQLRGGRRFGMAMRCGSSGTSGSLTPHAILRRPRLVVVSLMCAACAGAADARAPAARGVETSRVSVQTAPQGATVTTFALYTGVDALNIPHYAAIPISPADSLVLRRAYGVEDPHRLYVSDSSDERLLKYDRARKRCRSCVVDSYRLGYVSVRRPGESWDETERRVRHTSPHVFTGGAHATSRLTADLDPDVRPIAEAMLRAAHTAGFHLRVTATYRSPVHEAFLMAQGGARTHTLTSNHSYGRALDIVVDDANRGNARTEDDWIAFRRWVTRYPTPTGERFRILGRADNTWDWAHLELPSPTLGFTSIPQAVARGRACLSVHATIPCIFPPHIPAYSSHPLVR